MPETSEEQEATTDQNEISQAEYDSSVLADRRKRSRTPQNFEKRNPAEGEYVPKAQYTGPPVPKEVKEMPEFEKKEMADSSFLNKYNPQNREGAPQKMAQAAGTSAQAVGAGIQGAGTMANVAGKGAELGGQAMSAASKGVEAAGRVTRKAGSQIARAGARVSTAGYGLGAVVGVPMMAAGGVLAAGGAAAEGGGKAGQAAGRGVKAAGRGSQNIGGALRQAGGEVKDVGKGIKDMGKGVGDIANQMPENIKRILDAKKAAAKRAREGDLTGAAGEIVGAGISLATSQALAWSWRLIFLVFPLVWINIHFVARYLMKSDKFCDFGSEWKGLSSGNLPGVNEAGSMLEIGEIALLGFLDLLLLVIIFLVIGGIAMLNCVVDNPIGVLSGACG